MSGKVRTLAKRLTVVGLLFGVLASTVFAEKKHSSRQRSSSPSARYTTGTVTTEVLNVREQPAIKGHRAGALLQGAQVTVVGKYAGFYLIKTKGGLQGWVLWKYIEVEHPERVTALVFDKDSKTYIAKAPPKKAAPSKPSGTPKSATGAQSKPVVLAPKTAPAQTLSQPTKEKKPVRTLPLKIPRGDIAPPVMTRIPEVGEAVRVDPATALLLTGLDSHTRPPLRTRLAVFVPLRTMPSLASRPLVTEEDISVVAESEKSEKGKVLVDAAMEYRGIPYRRGATLPSRGFDCSGLVYHILKNYGFQSPRTAAELFQIGTPVAKSDLKEGDLVFFKNTYKRGISHVGIYLGNGRFIHASSRGGRVTVNRLDDDFYLKHYAGARRVTKE